MKKHELLKKAYDEYPKGTVARFKTAPNVDHVSTGKFRIIEGTGNGTCVVSEEDNACFYGSDTDEWAEIVKPKIAVKVDLKQSKILCEHLDLKHDLGEFTGEIAIYLNRIHEISTGSDICWDFIPNVDKDYQIIPFAEFAEEKGIKLPLLTSEDGVDLYEGDRYFMFDYEKGINGEFDDFRGEGFKIDHFPINGYEKQPIIFSTKQAALSWIEAQKPKIIKIGLYFGLNAHIFNETGEVHIFCKDNLLARLSTGDIMDIKSSIQ